MKKRIVSLLLAAVMLFSVMPVVGVAATEAPTLTVGSAAGRAGAAIVVPLTLTNNPGLAAVQLQLYYDSALILTDIAVGDALQSLTFTKPGDLTANPINLVMDGQDADNSNGTILILSFTIAHSAEEGVCPITVTAVPGGTYDNNMDDVELAIVNGAVTVRSYIMGDVNEDEARNTKDITIMRRQLAGGYTQSFLADAADVNYDGAFNTKDITTMRRYLAGGYGIDIDINPNVEVHTHTLEAHGAKDATCEGAGNYAYWFCAGCGKYFSDALGKTEITQAETIIAAKGHTPVIDHAVPATYTESGLTEGSHCAVCDFVITPQILIEPLKPNTKSITYHIVDRAKHPYLATKQIDESSLDHSYVPGEAKTLKGLDIILADYGYTFEGWYDGFGDSASQVKEIKATATGDIELFAHVTENVYDITYNLYQVPVDGGPTEEQKHYKVSQGNSNLYTPDINNYIFLGWYDNDGVEYKTIPVGTTGHITLNPYYTSVRNYAVSKEDNNPLILEDQNANVVYFTYEIGEIRNIPLNGDNPFWEIQSVAGLSQQVSETYTTSISTEEAEAISKTISDMTTNSSTWTLSENWNDVTTVNETWAESIGKTAEECLTEATTSSNTLSVTDQQGGSTYHKSEDGSTVYDYNSKTETKDKGHEFNASVNANYTNKVEANLGASTEYGATDSYGYTKQTKKTNTTNSSTNSDKDTLSAGVKYENGVEVNAGLSYGYHNNTTTVTKTGTDKVTTKSNIDENTSSWNNSATFSTTQQHSTSHSVKNTLSDIVTTTKGYGSSYSSGGSDTSSQGFSSTASNTSGTTSSVTYSKLESKTTTKTYSTDGKIEGKYRSILVGKAHVFAVVGYDYATKSFFTYTFSVMDDRTEEFLDYTPKGGNYTDCENSCLPFEIPFFVFEYVAEKTSKTSGLQYITNSKNGTARITGYTGTDADVTIPSYVTDGTQAYKVTEISATAFAGKPVRSVVLGEFIETIPGGAFKNCTALEEVIGSFTKIGNEAFAGCTSLTNMNIPSNVVEIGTDAFVGVSSISVRAINSLCAYAEALNVLPEGTADELVEAQQREITKAYITSVLNSGAQNITLDLSYIAANTPLSLDVPAIESIEISGNSKTYNDFSINSDAANTTINDMAINCNSGTAIKVDSDNLVLRKVFVTANTTALIMKKDGAKLSLIQDSAIEGGAQYSVIGKNLIIESRVTPAGAAGYLSVTGNFGYVNTITGASNADILNGALIQISEEDFEKYLQGVYTVTFNVNGGNVLGETEKAVYFGGTYGALPTPTRDYFTFDGWYTAAESGTKVTADTAFTTADDVQLYAHWTLNPLSDWVLESTVPSNAQTVNNKWTYTKTTNTESSSSTMDGWRQTGNYWKRVGNNSKNYATFPSGFDTGHSIYTTFDKSPYSSSETENAKVEVTNSFAGYVYYHWMYNVAYSNTTTRAISSKRLPSNSLSYVYFYAFTSSVDCPYLSNDYCNNQNIASYYCHNVLPETSSLGIGTPRFCRFEYYTSSYVRYEKVYQFEKQENLTSNTAISPASGISNIQHWVQYRAK